MLRWLPLSFLLGCSTVHGVRPIGTGGVSVDATVGGPFVELFGAPIPIPISTIGATVGVSDKTNVHAAIHPTGAILFGIFAGDVGVSTQLLAPKGARPRLMVDLTAIGAGGGVSQGDPRFFARPSFTASWDWGKQRNSTLYASLGGFIEPYPGPHGYGTIAVGNQFGLGKTTRLTTQVEWIAPYASSESLAPHWYAPGNMGAFSVQLGLNVLVGAPKPPKPPKAPKEPAAPAAPAEPPANPPAPEGT